MTLHKNTPRKIYFNFLYVCKFFALMNTRPANFNVALKNWDVLWMYAAQPSASHIKNCGTVYTARWGGGEGGGFAIQHKYL